MKELVKVVLIGLLIVGAFIAGDRCGHRTGVKQGESRGRLFAGWEFYEKVATSVLDGKMILGTVDLGDNAILSDVIIISSGDGVVVKGQNATIVNCQLISKSLGYGNYSLESGPL